MVAKPRTGSVGPVCTVDGPGRRRTVRTLTEKEPLQQQVAAPYVPYNNPSSLKMRPRADSTALAVRATEPAGSPGREPDVLESV